MFKFGLEHRQSKNDGGKLQNNSKRLNHLENYATVRKGVEHFQFKQPAPASRSVGQTAPLNGGGSTTQQI